MRQRGFTVIEVVVSTGLFAFVISSFLAVYIAGVQLDRKFRAQRNINENVRYITEFITREVRNGRIDYSRYPGGQITSTRDLYVINEAGEQVHIYTNLVSCSTATPCNLVLSKVAGTTNITTSSVSITDFKFYIEPVLDPFTPAKTSNQQPRVTMVARLESSVGSKAVDKAVLNLQTTFSLRYYPSRD